MEHHNPIEGIEYLKIEEQPGTRCSLLVIYAHHHEDEIESTDKILHSLALMVPSLLKMLGSL